MQDDAEYFRKMADAFGEDLVDRTYPTDTAKSLARANLGIYRLAAATTERLDRIIAILEDK